MNGQTLIALTLNDLDRIAIGIRQQVADGFKDITSHVVEKPLTVKQAADYLGIKQSAFYNRINRGEIPARLVHRNGGTPYFFASELCELIKTS